MCDEKRAHENIADPIDERKNRASEAERSRNGKKRERSGNLRMNTISESCGHQIGCNGTTKDAMMRDGRVRMWLGSSVADEKEDGRMWDRNIRVQHDGHAVVHYHDDDQRWLATVRQ